MSARNLHRITSAVFEHTHPECGLCAHFADGSPEDWARGFEGRCAKKGKTLCCMKSRPCSDFLAAPAEHPLADLLADRPSHSTADPGEDDGGGQVTGI